MAENFKKMEATRQERESSKAEKREDEGEERSEKKAGGEREAREGW